MSQRFQTTQLPGLGKDYIIHRLFIRGQFEPMHLAFPIRQSHLKQSTFKPEFILQKPGFAVRKMKVQNDGTFQVAHPQPLTSVVKVFGSWQQIISPGVFLWRPSDLWCVWAGDFWSGCWVSLCLSSSRCPPELSTVWTHQMENNAETCQMDEHIRFYCKDILNSDLIQNSNSDSNGLLKETGIINRLNSHQHTANWGVF